MDKNDLNKWCNRVLKTRSLSLKDKLNWWWYDCGHNSSRKHHKIPYVAKMTGLWTRLFNCVFHRSWQHNHFLVITAQTFGNKSFTRLWCINHKHSIDTHSSNVKLAAVAFKNNLIYVARCHNRMILNYNHRFKLHK